MLLAYLWGKSNSGTLAIISRETGRHIMKKTDLDASLMPVLNEDICHHLGVAVKPIALSTHRKENMRMGILDRIDYQPELQDNLLKTIRNSEGDWIQIAPKLKKKQLFIDSEKRVESFLLKAEAGAEIPAHLHQHDEFSMILEGSVHFEQLQLNVGDYHIAQKGSFHGNATCPTGALIYRQNTKVDHANI